MLNLSLDQAKTWIDSGSPLSMSVNLSARCLLDSTLPETVRIALERTGVPAGLLMLEITESAIMSDPVRAGEVIRRLHSLGVLLSIDDFGTGYTSMSYLRDLPVDELKIDRSFVMRMLRDTKDAVIVHTSIDLARRLGMRAIAEGVEDETPGTRSRLWTATPRRATCSAERYRATSSWRGSPSGASNTPSHKLRWLPGGNECDPCRGRD